MPLLMSKMRLYLWIMTSLLASPSLAETLSVSGNPPRNLDTGTQMDVQLTIERIPSQTSALQTGESNYYGRFVLRIPPMGDVKYKGADSSTVDSVFYFEQRSEPRRARESGSDFYSLTFYLRIRATNGHNLGELVSTVDTEKVIKFEVDYTPPGASVQKLLDEIPVISALPDAEPLISAVVGSHKSLVISWEVPTSVAYNNNLEYPYSGMQVYVYDNPEQDAILTAASFQFQANADTDPVVTSDDQACRYDAAQRDGGACLTCPQNDVYLSFENIGKIAGFSNSIAANNSPMGIEGLENGKEYVVVLQYASNGLQYSTCRVGIPQETFSMGELNGEKEGKETKRNCFIATAAYGSPLHANIDELRWFRDQVLRKGKIGRSFITWYETNSPAAANYIAEREGLRIATRVMLWPLVQFVKAFHLLTERDQ